MQTNLRKITALILIVLLAFLAGSSVVSAQEGGVQETFDNSNLEGWEVSTGVTVADGVLNLLPGNYAMRFGNWSSLNLEVKIQFSGDGEVLVGYSVGDDGRYAVVFAEGRLLLEKQQGPSPEVLGSSEVSALQKSTWVTLKIVQSGQQHQVYVNDELQLTATDSSQLTPAAIFFQALGEVTIQIDDLNVSGSTAENVLPSGETSPSGDEPQPAEEPLPPGEEPPASPPDPGIAPVVPSIPQSGSGGSNLIDEFFASQASTISLTTFLINLILAAICAYILSVAYIHWGSSLTNRRKFAANFMLLTVTTTFIILVVRSSVALSLGLVGALSIVRFRAAVKEPEELAYLFFAIGIGIGLGDNQRLVTMIAMAAGIGLIGLRQVFRKKDADVNLHVSVASPSPSAVTLEQITEALRLHTAKMKLLRFDEIPETLEAAYLIEFRHMDQLSEARAALRSLSESLEITFMDNKGIW